jgi:hypothetical protein
VERHSISYQVGYSSEYVEGVFSEVRLRDPG